MEPVSVGDIAACVSAGAALIALVLAIWANICSRAAARSAEAALLIDKEAQRIEIFDILSQVSTHFANWYHFSFTTPGTESHYPRNEQLIMTLADHSRFLTALLRYNTYFTPVRTLGEEKSVAPPTL